MSYMGTDEGRINRAAASRRAVLAGITALAAVPGRAADRHAHVLSWRGRAHAEVGGRSLDLVSETRLEVPLLRVRSTSWIVAQGPATARTMVLEPDGAWIERAGARAPLPPRIANHERQQYAIYTLLLGVQERRRRPGAMTVAVPPQPTAVFTIGSDGYPVAADLAVDAPEDGKPPIREHVTFSGRIDSHGVRWPRRFVIEQDGKPYFSLDLETFTASS